MLQCQNIKTFVVTKMVISVKSYIEKGNANYQWISNENKKEKIPPLFNLRIFYFSLSTISFFFTISLQAFAAQDVVIEGSREAFENKERQVADAQVEAGQEGGGIMAVMGRQQCPTSSDKRPAELQQHHHQHQPPQEHQSKLPEHKSAASPAAASTTNQILLNGKITVRNIFPLRITISIYHS